MSKLIAFESVTLDGVMQAPGRPDEDRRDGFEHGGWAVPYADPIMWEGMGGPGALLLGRRTYEDFYGFGRASADAHRAIGRSAAGRTACQPETSSSSRGDPRV